MSCAIYLNITGQRQGLISAGCSTSASVGNYWRAGHEGEILAFSLANKITSTGKGCNLQTLSFCKLVDKSTPLLCNAINNNELLFMQFYFYRIDKAGRWEKYYFIELRNASVVKLFHNFNFNDLHSESVSVQYDYILCKNIVANTEFSYLALPVDYNNLFVPSPANKNRTLNSKGVGRLLAAGGIYNGNIEGYRKTAKQLGGDAPAGYDQVMNDQVKGGIIAGVSLVSALGVSRAEMVSHLSQLNKLHVLGKVEGEYSAINPGPLNEWLAETFSGGVYKEIRLTDDTVFFRGGTHSVQLGRFFSYETPQGIIQTRMDKALLPVWPDGKQSPLDSYHVISIPEGTKIYVGQVSYQTDLYAGGTEQVVIPAPWDIPGVKILHSGAIK
ncbi:type VI secretion system tube protein Hcp [Atlantibacter subterranea]|uniref:type VI secretion system tube protein TssD n=1 Tax=Atlantibacter subterraneus TaxID=255519 RepID=UPI00118433C2|nr:type VI secretion system tube protein TssD [Atlantibacter subterranea]TSJ59691.1 type VI secretion system tube protein Hcp [Atlantibacter subterranea]